MVQFSFTQIKLNWSFRSVTLHYAYDKFIMYTIKCLSDLWSVSKCPRNTMFLLSLLSYVGLTYNFMLFHSTTLLEWTVSCALKASTDLTVFPLSLHLDAYVSRNMFFFPPSLINCCYCKSSARTSDNLPHQLHTCLCCKGQYYLFLFIWSIRTSIPLRYRLKSIYSPFIFKSVATEHFHQTHFQCRGFWKQIKLHYVGYLWERLERSSNRFIFTEGSSLSRDRHQRHQHANTTGTSAWVTAKLGLAIVYVTLMGCGCPSPHK